MKVGGNYGPVISAWAFSSSAGTTVYETQLHADGLLTCNCPGWIMHSNRICKHTKGVSDLASSIFQKHSDPVWQQKDSVVLKNPKYGTTNFGKKRLFRMVEVG